MFKNPKRADQVFQLSLTEIAFTICFILMLLLGYMVFKEKLERQAIEEKAKAVENAPAITSALDAARANLAQALRDSKVANPDDVISKLIAEQSLRAERDTLKARVHDLNAQVSALTDIKAMLQNANGADGKKLVESEVAGALALQRDAREAVKEARQKPSSLQVSERETRDAIKEALSTRSELEKRLRSDLNRNLEPGKGPESVAELVRAAKQLEELSQKSGSPEAIKKENSDLRGQVAFLKGRLEARGGRDYPPCWADEATGKVQTLFSVEVRADGVAVLPAWPPVREADAKALPGIGALLEESPHSYADFARKVQGIFRLSQTQDCRHYVVLRSAIQDGVQSDRRRLEVEGYFYKIEVRR